MQNYNADKSLVTLRSSDGQSTWGVRGTPYLAGVYHHKLILACMLF